MSERDTIPATCPRCGRPVGNYSIESCPFPLRPWSGTDDNACRLVGLGYLRGIDEGVRLAKANVRTEVVFVTCRPPAACVDWTDVDEAAAAAKGERDDER